MDQIQGSLQFPEKRFIHPRDRNPETYYPVKEKFSRHCRNIYDWLMAGEHVTADLVHTRLNTHKGTSRVSDLRKAGVMFDQKMVILEDKSKYGEYWMTETQIEYNKKQFG